MFAYAFVVLLAGHCYAADIVDTLVAEKFASTLVQLVTKAGLADALKSGTFTVFAPSDVAFARVPQDVLTSLMSDVTKLADLLKYHVVSGSIGSSSLRNEEELATLNGAKLRANIYTHNEIVTVNGAKITETDRQADNGVIHFVDDVIMSPEGSIVDIVSGDSELSTLLTAVQKAGIANGFLETLEYHAIPHTLYSKGLWNHEYPKSSDSHEDRLHIRVGSSGVTINNAKVIEADHIATNGVVHKIDHVLIPIRVIFWLRAGK